MKLYSWILVSGGLVAFACAHGACGSSPTTTGIGGALSSSSTGGSGGTAPAAYVDCKAPSVPPSKGMCYTAPAMVAPPACPHAMPDAGDPDAGDPDSGASDGGPSDSGASDSGSAGGGGAGGAPSDGGVSDGGTSDGGVSDAGHPDSGTPDAGHADAGPSCASLGLMTNGCATCLVSTCCVELQACNAVPGCLACATDPNVDANSCTTPAIQAALAVVNTCANGCCTAHCFNPPGASCNPVTNAPCDVDAGEACDVYGTGFACFPAPNDATLCSPCDSAFGPSCAAGLHCLADATGDEACAQYCCDDGDCSASGKCDTSALGAGSPAGVGLCVPK